MLLTKEVLDKLKAEEIEAISIAEYGAMGSAGETIIITSNNTVYESGSIYEENGKEYIGAKIVMDKIDSLKDWKPVFGFSGENSFCSKINEDWYYIILGLGNHLLVREEFYNLHKNLIDTNDFFKNYRNWHRLVIIIQNNNR